MVSRSEFDLLVGQSVNVSVSWVRHPIQPGTQKYISETCLEHLYLNGQLTCHVKRDKNGKWKGKVEQLQVSINSEKK